MVVEKRHGGRDMARIRKVEINNFRTIKRFVWLPSAGINCLVGPGDVGKSTVLDAIDYCLGARRSIQITDADFHRLDVEAAIHISVTVGDLDDAFKRIDAYGLYLRGFHPETGLVEDEPEKDAETVLTVCLIVGSDLEPVWSLASDRAEAQGQLRPLAWTDRVRLAPVRLGVFADYHLGWRRGSVLNRLSDEQADASAALAKAARDARAAFGDEMQGQLAETLGIVSSATEELGIRTGGGVKALLDAHSISLSGGSISLHDGRGVPLSGLGTGSARMLISALQRTASSKTSAVLIDELEYGLEPHRIMRLLGLLGAKDKEPPFQAFMTTHSPVALRELCGEQVFVLRETGEDHEALTPGADGDIQATLRMHPDAFFARSVLLCEGASEVGLTRGLDQHRSANGKTSIAARGVALVDCGGGDGNRPFERASSFARLGYRTAVLRDDDKKPTPEIEQAYINNGGTVFAWREGRTLEDELFASLPDQAIAELLDIAADIHGEDLINDHIKSASSNSLDLKGVYAEILVDGLRPETRAALGKASQFRKSGWFKSVSWMERVGCTVVGPSIGAADEGFCRFIDELFAWCNDA